MEIIKGLFGAVMAIALFADADAGGYGAPAADIRDKLDTLVAAYPNYLLSHNNKEILWRDGTRMPVSDGRTDKSFDELLNSPDLDDMFAFTYPVGAELSAPGIDYDPGRIRYEPFFKKMYGDCRNDGSTLPTAKVAWVGKFGGKAVRITTVNDVHESLAKVSTDLERLPRNFIGFLKPSSGTYNCRTIAGTRRLSVHAFAAAIDINSKMADYWRWSKPDKNGNYIWRNKVPKDIVDIFERHGFIWGGRWYHYDTMHFEYRPELIGKQLH